MISKSWQSGLILAGSALALAGCGDSSTGLGITSTPPPVSYTKIADITGNRTFQTGGVTYNASASGFTNGASLAFGSGVTVAYNAAAESYTVTAPGGATQTFGPTELQPVNPQAPTSVTYVKTVGTTRDQLTLIAPGGSVPLSYTVFGTWGTINTGNNNGTYRIAVGGSPTVASDMPKTGTATYAIQVGGSAVNNGVAHTLSGYSSGSFSANFGSGTVTTALTLAGPPSSQLGGLVTNFGTFNGTGTIASGGPGYTGTMTGANAVSGLFSGAFFGPQALETSFGYYLSGGNFSAVGGASGIKQ